MSDILIARQPVFNRQYKLTAYELLFRSHGSQPHSGEHMTAQVMVSALMDIGLEKLSGGHPININATASFLQSDLDMLSALPPDMIGIEILESVPVNQDTIAACKKLKDKGFTILLDDVVYSPHLQPLIELADIIKVDLPQISNLAEEVRSLRQYPAQLLAEKVETLAQYEQVKLLDFDYVQGYFFSKPEIIEGRKLPDSKLAILNALRQVMTAEAVADIHHVIKQNVTLSYRLLKYINSVSFGMKRKVESIEQALSLLGLNNIRKWLSLLSLATLGESKSPELMKIALIRGHFLEAIALQRGEKEVGDDFLLGMFSALDCLLDMDMESALEGLYLPTGVREGLLNPKSDMGKKLALCIALEHGDWQHVMDWSEGGKMMRMQHITNAYTQALAWADAQVTTL
ncbi:MAG: EAL domain-containing protein [Mariprofundaceae bacterium]|nr:EAL domain-containing protein [Mariprofundaceae bacterium]